MMKVKKNAVTLKDIARATGFSVNTVSCAVGGRGSISASTAERIRQVAAQMGYVGNSMASAMRTGRSNTIAIILGDIGNAYFSIMVKELEICLRESGITAFILVSDEDEEREISAIQTALSKNVDGVILFPTGRSDRGVRLLRSAGIPFVLLGRHLNEEGMDAVVSDDVKGGRIATEHLFRRGHRRILAFVGPSYISCARERYRGYELAHQEAGISLDPALIYPCDVAISEAALAGMDRALMGAANYTAIFTFNDIIAFASIERLKRLRPGLSIDVVGYDHLQSHIQFGYRIASIETDKRGMACKAAELIMARVNGRKNRLSYRRIVTDVALALDETGCSPGRI
jgi:LacI family transcriptional regulator